MLNISRSKRKEIILVEPQKLKSWVIHFFSEIFGTFILTFMFGGLFIVLPNGHYVIAYLYSPIFISLYSGFIVVGILSLFFKRWSSDLNPIISIYKLIIGAETYRYCFFKIFSQIIGSILCGVAIMYFTSDIVKTGRNVFINNIVTNHGFFDIQVFSKFEGFIFTVICEFIVGTLFVWTVFTKSIRNAYKQMTTFIIITFVAFFAISNGTSSFNLFRAFAQDFALIISGKMSIYLWITFSATVISTILTPFLFLFLQYIFVNYINVWLRRLIYSEKSKKGK